MGDSAKKEGKNFLKQYSQFSNYNGTIQVRKNQVLVSFPFGKRELQKMVLLALKYDQGKGSMLISMRNIEDLKHLVDMIDPNRYLDDKSAMDTLDFLKVILQLVIDGFSTDDILSRCKQEMEQCYQEHVIDQLDNMTDYLLTTNDDIRAFIKSLYEYLKFACVLLFYKSVEDELFELDIYKLKPEKTYKLIIDAAKKLVKDVNKMKVEDDSSVEFNLNKKSLQAIAQYMIDEEKNNSYAVYTGIKAFNYMIRGFLPGRLYVFLAGSGVFKSNMLLLVAYWAKIYNELKVKDETKIPAVLFISNENTVEDTFERLFALAGGKGPVGLHTQAEIFQQFRKVGFETNEENKTQVFFEYRGYNTISTDDIRDMIDNLKMEGYEVRLVVLDYLKRIRPVYEEKDERLKLGNITNDLKKLAVDYHIPVVTAQQTNRSTNISIKEAKESNKKDVGKVSHQTGVAGAWDIIENSDAVFSLTILEKCPEDGKRYLCICENKKRTKGFADYTYIEHPFKRNSNLLLEEDIMEKKSMSRLEYDLRSNGLTVEDFVVDNKNYQYEVKKGNGPQWEKRKSRPSFQEYCESNLADDEKLEIEIVEDNPLVPTNIEYLLSKIYYDIDFKKASEYINDSRKKENLMKESYQLVARNTNDDNCVKNAKAVSLDYYDLMKMAERKRMLMLDKKAKKKAEKTKKKKKKNKLLDFGPSKYYFDKDDIPEIDDKDELSKENRKGIKLNGYNFYTRKFIEEDNIDEGELIGSIIRIDGRKSENISRPVKVENPFIVKSKKKKDKGSLKNYPYIDTDYELDILDSITIDDIENFELNSSDYWKPKKIKIDNDKIFAKGDSLNDDALSKRKKKEEKEYNKEKKKAKKEKRWYEELDEISDTYIPPKEIDFAPYGLSKKERIESIKEYREAEKFINSIYFPKNKIVKKLLKKYKKFFDYLDSTIYSSLYSNLDEEGKNKVIDGIFKEYNKIMDYVWKEVVEYEKAVFDGERLYTDCPNAFRVGVERKIKRVDFTFCSMKKLEKLKEKYVVYDHTISKKEAIKLDKNRIKNLELMRDCIFGTFFGKTIDPLIDSIEISKMISKHRRRELKRYDNIRNSLVRYEANLTNEEREEIAKVREANRRVSIANAEKIIKSKYGDIPIQYFDQEVLEETLGHKVPNDFYKRLSYNTALENLEMMNENWNEKEIFHELTGRRGNTFPEFEDRHKGLPDNSLADYASAIADHGYTPEELEEQIPGCYEKAKKKDNERWKKVYDRLKQACQAAEEIRIGNDEDILEDTIDDIINTELDRIDSKRVNDWKHERNMIMSDNLDEIFNMF